MKISRRDLIIAASAGALGCVVTGTAGLTAYKIRKSAWSTPAPTAVASDGWLLSDDDLAEMAKLDALPETEAFELQPAVDFMGGDIEALEVTGLGQCVEVCEDNRQCKAFTYAKTSHPNADKRLMCWLKDGAVNARTDSGYVSGVRR